MTAHVVLPAQARPSVPIRFLAVPFRAQTWRNVAYLALSFPLGLTYVIVLTIGLVTGAALAMVLVGLGILVCTLLAWRAMAALERALARSLLRVTIHPPVDRGPGLSTLERVKRWIRDPVTWKSLVFVVGKLPMGVVALAGLGVLGSISALMATSPLIVIGTPITFFGWEIDTPAQALPLVVPGLLALLLCLHLYNGLAWLYGLAARVMLGPSTVELRERVDDLRGSRARIIAAADAERRRIERDLHDGAQQRLVALALTLGVAENRLGQDPATAAPLIAQAREEAQLAVQELRELARGIHPAVLADRGLEPAMEALASRAPIPVQVTGLPEHRLPPPVEAAVYFVVAEALTNVAKYAEASAATVHLESAHGRLTLTVSDDGRGGADLGSGSGLRGLRDRVEALDGVFSVDSPPGHGTTITAEIPLVRE